MFLPMFRKMGSVGPMSQSAMSAEMSYKWQNLPTIWLFNSNMALHEYMQPFA